ncbi:ABC transporter permease [Kordiimonas sp. SCSIO 12610]|uniref:MlaE family ABC transporter permease n=1 Tax=Kordiimonas sp. SCSIO 12610 TaxID=2829597 RepID=UPI0021095BA1|nr:ABC transporter permease [Kordiimonas sp. SCSIO 12610]UTW55165.1 ABC transporter permease [Kordiimonas sp. SCSIO 12610]
MAGSKNITISSFITLDTSGPSVMITLLGDWVLDNAQQIDKDMNKVASLCQNGAVLDCSSIQGLDTAGALLVRRYAMAVDDAGSAILTGVLAQHKNLLDVVSACPPPAPTEPDHDPWYVTVLYELGESAFSFMNSARNLLGFIGLVLSRLFGAIFDPGRIRVIPLIHQLEVVGLKAMGIVGLISFLIGAVMVNQGAVQLAKFGADIFVIDMLGISHLRELGILLTAIIVAGRSGSSFTAQIGSMRLNEEVDAMTTLGMNTLDVLVLPRLLALLIALPLLGFYADILGIMGGIVMAWFQLDIAPANFIVYFRDVITLDHFMAGILKAPFFAIVIVVSGCYHGLAVSGSAASLGMRTTRSVVQSIFLVIVLDAFFAVFFTAIGL